MSTSNKGSSMLSSFVGKIEKYIVKALIAMMSLLLILATIELAYTIYKSLLANGEETLFINLDNLLNVFGVFLLVLIGIELLDTIKVYFKKHIVHVEVVLLVAIIAIARKVIVMDFEKYSGIEIIGIALVILALAGGYYLIKKTGGCGFWPIEKEVVQDIIAEEIIEPKKKVVAERIKSLHESQQMDAVGGGQADEDTEDISDSGHQDNTSTSGMAKKM